MSSDRILPCPFCGKAPTVEPENPAVEGDAWTGVGCVCPARPRVVVYQDRGHREEAIRLWNTRIKS